MSKQTYHFYFLNPDVREFLGGDEYVRYVPLYTVITAQSLGEAEQLSEVYLKGCSCVLDGERFMAVPQRLARLVETTVKEWQFDKTKWPDSIAHEIQDILEKQLSRA